MAKDKEQQSMATDGFPLGDARRAAGGILAQRWGAKTMADLRRRFGDAFAPGIPDGVLLRNILPTLDGASLFVLAEADRAGESPERE